mmetsp:Transcript_3394/g.7658  ORF Transcript_3394/g.7658 Transcript_3394/m.7658 type:complete len:305 (-) Transcript_3394:61-975(-)
MSQSIAAALGSARADVESFWQRRYTGGQLGWHKNDVNPHLIKNLDRLLPPPSSGDEDTSPAGTSVFVPLCGKSVDLAHLADHPRVSTVVGIDIVKDAAEEFAAEHPSLGVREVVLGDVCTAGDERTGLVCDDAASVGDGGPTAQRDDITFLVGDLFHFLEMDPAARAEHTSLRSDAPDERPARDGLFDAVYDRASMIAVHPSLREKYASQIGDVLRPGGTMLLVTIDRRVTSSDEAKRDGPPFSIDEAEVQELYGGQGWVESVSLLEEVDDLTRDGSRERWAKKGVLQLYELVFVIKKKAQDLH